MKHSHLLLPTLMFAVVFSSACSKKNNTNGPGGTPVTGAAKYPATVTKTDASGQLITTYDYNDKKQLIAYHREDGERRDFGTAQIVETVPLPGGTIATNTSTFENMTGANVYEGGSVGRMLWASAYKYPSGGTQTEKRGIPTLTSTADGRIENDHTILYVPAASPTIYYTHDDKKTSNKLNFFNLLIRSGHSTA